MISLDALLSLNSRDVKSIAVFAHPSVRAYGLFSLDYGDCAPLFYASGAMIAGTDRRAQPRPCVWVQDNALCYRYATEDLFGAPCYLWKYYDLSGKWVSSAYTSRGNSGRRALPFTVAVPENAPRIIRIPQGAPFKIAPDDAVLGNVKIPYPDALWVMHNQAVYPLPAYPSQMQGRLNDLGRYIYHLTQAPGCAVNYLRRYLAMLCYLETVYMPQQLAMGVYVNLYKQLDMVTLQR